jgi:hypothetical protein
MRSDIEAAVRRLDKKGANALTGLQANRHHKKTLPRLDELIGSQEVIALAPARDPVATTSQMVASGGGIGGALGSAMENAKSYRLLVLTDQSLWEVQAGGRLGGSAPVGVEIPLTHVTGVRQRTDRHASHLGRKTRILMVDYYRGTNLVTRVHEIMSDGAMTTLVDALEGSVQEAHVGAAAAEDEHQIELSRKAAEAFAAAAQRPSSVADELAKLVALRDQGALTSEEFEAMKGKLLAS